MINASKDFKEKLKNGGVVANYAFVTLSDGTRLHLEAKDFMIGGCTIEDKTTDGKFGVGFCIGKTLTLRIANHDEQFSQYDFYNAVINLYIDMQLDDGSIERIRKGIYYVTVPSTTGDIIEISAVDGMYKLDRDFAESTKTYPATLQNIISSICLDCGIPIGFKQFDNMGFVVWEKPENVTYRQVLSYACQIAGYNAHIDVDGYMQLIWYDTALLERYNYVGGNFKLYPHDTALDGGNFTNYTADTIIAGGDFTEDFVHVFRVKSLNINTDDVIITGVRVTGNDKNTAMFGEDGYVIEVKSNPLVSGQEQAVADYLGERMVGITFRPFSAEVLGNPLYEPFEIVKISDKKGNVYNSLINFVSYKIGGYTQISCKAEDPIRNGSTYSSPAAQAVAEARRNTEKQLTTYDEAVQNMNQLAMNAMGFHTTYEEQEDGSRITYLHDKPTLEESTTIYKQTIDGFFISQDGGKSYTAGFDKDGNAVVNILYAIGIVCDWIRGGTLTLGGDNNINGDLVVYDAEGNVVGRFNKDGLWASNGYFEGDITSANAQIMGGKIDIQSSSETFDVIKLNGLNNRYFSANPYSIKVGGPGGYIYIYDYGIIFGSGGHLSTAGGTLSISATWGSITYLTATTLTCAGVKSRVIDTPDYGQVLQYCYETPSPMFGDIGTGKIDETGICYIFFDSVFKETVSTDRTYQVFLQKEGQGDIWVEEKTEEYFIVKGTAGIAFSWEVKVKQRDYEYERLEVFDSSKKETDIDYGNEAVLYLDNFEKEMLEYEEIN